MNDFFLTLARTFRILYSEYYIIIIIIFRVKKNFQWKCILISGLYSSILKLRKE